MEVNWQLPPNKLALKPNELHLWKVSLVADDKETNTLAALLTEAELARAKRFMFDKHRRRFIISRAYLRILLGRYLSIKPEEVTFTYGEHGKPYVDHANLQFNMSNSGEFALYGFVESKEIGVDIEQWKDRIHSEEIVTGSFADDEIAQYKTLRADQKQAAFFRGWTSKEAYIKAIGKGLYHDLKSFVVCMDPDKPARFLKIDGTEEQAKHWQLYNFFSDEQLSTAIAVEGHDYTLAFFIGRE